jgi:hypothetical protein
MMAQPRRPATDLHPALPAGDRDLLWPGAVSNSELGSWLFISAETVHHHPAQGLRQLTISSRSQIDRALSDDTTATEPG